MQGHDFQGLFGRRKLLWQTRWGFYCLGIDELCPIGAVLSVDDSPAHSMISKQTDASFFSLESNWGWRVAGQDSIIEEIVPALGEHVVRLLSRSAENWTAISTHPSPALLQFAARMGIACICPPPELCDWLNDKANFLTAVAEIGLPRLNGCWVRLSEMSYADLHKHVGASFAAQLPRGCSGSGTFFVGCEDDYVQLAADRGNALMWVVPDVGDLSLNVNAIATDRGTAVGYPSVQLARVTRLCRNRGQYCGNDYAATAGLERQIVEAVVVQTARIGEWLASLGYCGLFGLDFVVDNGCNQVYAVDLNPRWQGSTWLLGQAQRELGRLPLPVAEVGYRMGLLSAAEVLRNSDEFLSPVWVSQFALRSQEPGWSTIGSAVEPGIYSFADGVGGPRPTLRLRDLENDAEFLLVGVPRADLKIAPGGHMLRVCSRGPVYDLARARLLARAEHAARQLYLSLALTVAEPPNGNNSRRQTSGDIAESSNQCHQSARNIPD